MNNKIEAIDTLLHDSNADMILSLTETWHEDSASVAIGRLRALGYNVVEEARKIEDAVDRNTVSYTNHGGVVILSKMNFRLVKRLTIGNITTFEHVCCEITLGCTKCIILSIYRPGSSPPQAKFFSEFESNLIFQRPSVNNQPNGCHQWRY